jgi:PTS system cellobiose-specific IIC component
VSNNKKFNGFLNKVTKISAKIGSQIHLRSMRDAFLLTLPYLILAGLMIMFNNVIIAPNGILSGIISPNTLTTWQEIGNRIVNGTMNVLAIFMTVLLAYIYAGNKKYESPIVASVISVGALFTLMPAVNEIIPVGASKAVEISGVVSFTHLGTSGIFVGIITALTATSLFIKISENKRFKVNISGPTVPPAVVKSFNTLFPVMITISIFALVSFTINQISGYEVHDLINKILQAPLVKLTTSLPGFIVFEVLIGLIFGVGIHPGGIINPIMEPPLLVAMQQNMDAYLAGIDIPNIIVLPFRDLYGHLGGTGCTIALLIAIFIFSKRKDLKTFAKVSITPGLFNINEPVIFGFPIIFNPIMVIPFIIAPVVNVIIAYFATYFEFVSKIVVYVPWSVPPILSGWIGSGGDFRNSILQIILIAINVFIFLPFLKLHEHTLEAQGTEEDDEDIVF